MAPLLEHGVNLDPGIRYRFVSNGKTIACAPHDLFGFDSSRPDNNLTHTQLAIKYKLSTEIDEHGRPFVASAGWLEPVMSDKGYKWRLDNEVNTCALKGNWKERETAFANVRQKLIEILGEDKVAVGE